MPTQQLTKTLSAEDPSRAAPLERFDPLSFAKLACGLAAVGLPILTIVWRRFSIAIAGKSPYADATSLAYAIYYVAPMTGLAPLWLRCRLGQLSDASASRVLLDALVLVLSATRSVPWITLLPFSGHALFLVYTLATTPDRLYRALAMAVLAETTFLKLVVWHDPTSWSVGLVAALGLVALHRRAAVPYRETSTAP